MKKLAIFLALAWGWPCEATRAFVSDGNCAVCHASSSQNGAARPGSMDVLGQGLLDLGKTRNDGALRGAIPYFAAYPGEVVSLTMRVLNGRTRYAVSLDGLRNDSVSEQANTRFLTSFGADPAWFGNGATPTFFTNVGSLPGGFDWPLIGQTAPRSYSFDLALDPETPSAVYELEFFVAGVTSFPTRTKFVDSRFFYLQVLEPVAGDLDRDGHVDGDDFLLWQRGASPNPSSAADFTAWEQNFGTVAGASTDAAQATPEPAAWSLVLSAWAVVATRARCPGGPASRARCPGSFSLRRRA